MTYSLCARPGKIPATLPGFLALALTVLASAATTVPSAEAADTPIADELRREVPYKLKIDGPIDASMRTLLESVSTLYSDIKTPPVSEVGLRRRVRADHDAIRAALRSEGYYAANVRDQIDLEVSPAEIRLEVTPGERYVIDRITFALTDERPMPHAVVLLRSLAPPAPRTPARSEVVASLATDAVRTFADQGYLGVAVGERTFYVDHATRTLRGTIQISAGTRAKFGPTRFEGLTAVREDYARTLVRWHEGEFLLRDRIEVANTAMLATGLFDSVRILREPPAPGEDATPVRVVVVERPFRSIGFGLEYDSTDGLGANTFWEHRNLGGAGRRLRLSIHGGQREIGGGASYRQPNFFLPDQAFLADLEVGVEDTKAYESEGVTATVGLERQMSARVVARVGLSLDTGSVEAEAADDGTNGNENLTFVGVPLFVRYDGSDDLLAPTEGLRLDYATTPFFELFGAGAAFSKNRLTLRGYRPLDAKDRWIGALRLSGGSIVGEGRSQVPIDKRFFSGGGGSVRGYEYQFAGPLGADRTDPTKRRPLGGRSILEAGGELRLRIGESFGLVGFVDGGSAYEHAVPELDEKFFVGAGLGGRYYTGIGPIRVDVATPINGRSSDDPVQLYISIGESY